MAVRLPGAVPGRDAQPAESREQPDHHQRGLHPVHVDDHDLGGGDRDPGRDRLPGLDLLGLPQADLRPPHRRRRGAARHPSDAEPWPSTGWRSTEPGAAPSTRGCCGGPGPPAVYLLAGIAVGTATAAVIVGQAWLLATAISGTFSRRDLSAVMATIGPLAAVFLARGLLSWLNTVLAQRSAAAVKSQLRTEIMTARLRRAGRPGARRARTGPGWCPCSPRDSTPWTATSAATCRSSCWPPPCP